MTDVVSQSKPTPFYRSLGIVHTIPFAFAAI